MGYRPHPNCDRALKQIHRHIDEVGPLVSPRPVTPSGRRLFEGAAAAMQAVLPSAREFQARLADALSKQPTLDDYRLSTRPSVVSPSP